MVPEKQQEESIELIVSDAAIVSEPAMDLGEQYEVIAQIGSGGMAVVYKVREVATGTFFAAKVLKNDLASDESSMKRFRQEAALVKRLEHPHIVKIKDYSLTKNGVPVLIMEWSEGETLADRIKNTGPVSAKESLAIFAQISRALTYAHGLGIIHRDIKPSNIFLVDNDGGPVVKIMDFGIAKILESEQSDNGQTQSGQVLGSPAYMSPEQCLGEAVDARSDLYSLGCVMYETLTGINPFIAPTPVATILKHLEYDPPPLSSEEFARLRIPSSLEKVVTRCLAKEPAARWQTAKNVEEELFPQPSPVRSIVAVGFDLLIASWVTGLIQYLLIMANNDTLALHRGLWMQLYCVVFVMYSTVFEASPMRRTLGKAIAGLKVVGSDGAGAPLLSGLGVSLSICAILVVMLTYGAIADTALPVDRVMNTWYSLLSDVTWWVLAAFWIYGAYLLGYIYRRSKQAHVDSFFGRRIILSKLSSLYDGKKRRKGLRKRETVAVVLSLLIIGILPQLRDHVSDFAWGDPAVTKDLVLGAQENIKEGEVIHAEKVKQIPILRGGRAGDDNAAMTEVTIVGKTASCDIGAGVPFRPYYVKDFENSEYGAPYWADLATEQAARGDDVVAEQSFQRALKSNIRDRDALFGLAKLYKKQGRQQKADEFRKAAVNAIVLPNASLAMLLNDQREYEAAYAVARRSVAANPDDIKSLQQLKIACDGLEAFVSSAQAVQRIEEIRQGRIAQLDSLIESGQPPEVVIAQALKYINLDNQDSAMFWKLGEILKSKGDNARAIFAVDKAVSLDKTLLEKRNAFVAGLKK